MSNTTTDINNSNPVFNTIHLLNIQSLRSRNGSKLIELERHTLKYKPNFVCLNETWLTQRQSLVLSGYNCARADRQTGQRGGGTAILVKNSYAFHQINFDIQFRLIEVCAVHVKCVNNSFIVATVYKKPSNKLIDEDLNSLLNVLSSLTENFIICGDFNAHHNQFGSDFNSADGNKLVSFCFDHDLAIHRTAYPSRITTTSQSFIDIFISSSSIQEANFGYLQTIPFSSDHDVVKFNFKTSSKIEYEKKHTFLNWARVDIIEFQTKIDHIIDVAPICIEKTMSVGEIDEATNWLNTKIAEVVEELIPKISYARNYQNCLDSTTINLMKERDKRRRTFRRKKRALSRTFATQREFEELAEYKSHLNNLERIIRERVRECTSKAFISKLQNIRNGPELFKSIKQVSAYKKREYGFNDIEVNGQRITSRTEQAEHFANHFEKIHNDAAARGNADFTARIEEEIRCLKNNVPLVEFTEVNNAFNIGSEDDRFTTLEELLQFKRIMNSKHSAGVDGISNHMLKRMPQSFFEFLTILMNQCIARKYFPQQWKLTTITPLLKAGQQKDNIKSFRPISLVSNVSKLLERVIMRQLRSFSDEMNLIPPNQFGFRPKHSCNDALTIVSALISNALNEKKPVLMVSLDTSKAFDSMWKDGLIWKLKEAGFPEYIVSLVASFLHDRFFAVQVSSETSTWRSMEAGTPQGSVLGPILFSLFLADIPLPNLYNEEHQETNSHLGEDPARSDESTGSPTLRSPTDATAHDEGDDSAMEAILFADDYVLLAWGSDPLLVERRANEYLDVVHEFNTKWKLHVNTEKSSILKVFGLKKNLNKKAVKRMKEVEIVVGDAVLSEKQQMSYLGVVFDPKFNFVQHLNGIKRKTLAVLASFRHLAGRDKLRTDVKKCLYKVAIRSIVTYGFSSWHNVSAAQMERLRILERKALRFVQGDGGRKPDSFKYISNDQLYDNTQTQRIDLQCVEIGVGYLRGALNSSNQLVRQYLGADAVFDCRGPYRHPKMLLVDQLGGRIIADDVVELYHGRSRGQRGLVYNTALGTSVRRQIF